MPRRPRPPHEVHTLRALHPNAGAPGGAQESFGVRADLVTYGKALAARSLPARVANLTSVFTTLFTQPGRYAWMLQHCLRAHGIAMSWVGTGRLIFSHDFTDEDFAEFRDRFVEAVEAMRRDG